MGGLSYVGKFSKPFTKFVVPILSKAVVTLLILKLTAIKIHLKSLTKKHIIFS